MTGNFNCRSLEVSIVYSTFPLHRKSDQKCTHQVRHDAQLVQRGLPVEQHHVPVYEVSLHNVPVLELLSHFFPISVFQKPEHTIVNVCENKVSSPRFSLFITEFKF